MGYPYSRRIAASSLSPSAPLRCDRFPPFARLASPTCELLLFCGVVYRLLPFGVSCGFLTAVEGCPLCASIKFLVKLHFADSTGEKVVDSIVAVSELSLEISVNHGRIFVRVNVCDTAALFFAGNEWHLLTYPHDLVRLNRRMRVSHDLLILRKEVFEHRHALFKGIRSFRINACGYVLELLKIKKQRLSSPSERERVAWCAKARHTLLPSYKSISILVLFLVLFLLLCRALSVDIDRFVSLGVYALFISLPCLFHVREESRKGDFLQRMQRVGDLTGFQILPTSKKDIDRSFRRELLYKLPPFNFQFEPRWMFLFNFRHLLTTLLELLARSCAAACPRRHRGYGVSRGGGDPAP